MMIKKITGRKKRQIRIRQRLAGTPVRPRLCVFMSNMHIYAQIIDDLAGKTLVAAGTVSKSMKETKINAKSAAAIGKQIAELAKQKNITQVVFDRAGYRYQGKVKSLADAAREAGLKF